MWIEGLDEIDNKILSVIKDNARLSYKDIGEQVGISRVSVKARMDSMQEKGIIKGFQTVIDPTKVPDGTRFFLNLECAQEFYEDLVGLLAGNKMIRQIYGVSGDCRIHASGYAKDSRNLENFANAIYRGQHGVRRLSCRTVLSAMMDRDGGVNYVRYRNLNIWKKKENHEELRKAYLNTEITELNLSVRSYNCLKRAGCNTIGDILKLTDEEGNGLRKIRNLGSRSEKEILEAVRIYRENSQYNQAQHKKERPINPGVVDIADADVVIFKRKQMRSELGLWETDIDAFDLSQYAMTSLRNCGILRIKDLYATNPKNEFGWYAVREPFEKIDAG